MANHTRSVAHLLPTQSQLYAPNRKFPAYGKRVKAILENPALLCRYSGCTASRATVWISTEWDWPEYHPHHLCIVISADHDPVDYQWSFLQGHEPILLTEDLSDNTLFAEQVARALIRDSVMTVVTVGNNNLIYRTQQHDS